MNIPRYILESFDEKSKEVKELRAQLDIAKTERDAAVRERDALQLEYNKVYDALGLEQQRADRAELSRDAAVKAFRSLFDVLEDARDHLQYTGYGDSYERAVARQERLPERISEALEMGSG